MILKLVNGTTANEHLLIKATEVILLMRCPGGIIKQVDKTNLILFGIIVALLKNLELENTLAVSVIRTQLTRFGDRGIAWWGSPSSFKWGGG